MAGAPDLLDSGAFEAIPQLKQGMDNLSRSYIEAGYSSGFRSRNIAVPVYCSHQEKG
jgi:hypothetical protein